MAKRMIDLIVPDLPYNSGDEVVALVSGLGSTPAMELYIFFSEVEKLLTARGITLYRPYVGNLFTSLEMNGVTLTLMKLDAELKQCIDFEADSMGLRQFGPKR
jgi:dihydroxyacetone kinase-like protein